MVKFIDMQKERLPILFEIIIALSFTVFNLIVFRLAVIFNVPIYMDTIFTACAAFFGFLPGILTGLLTQLLMVIFYDSAPSAYLFAICNVSVAIVVYLITCKSVRVKAFQLVLASIFASIIVAIEGGIIYTFLYTLKNYEDLTQIKFFVIEFLNQDISLLLASILGRIPISLIDKTISVFVGFFIYKSVNRFFYKRRKSSVSVK